MIQFIKILPYELRPKNIDIYQYLTRLGLQRIDPPSLEPNRLASEAKTILHSRLRRASDCIEIKPNVTYLPMSSLNEVLFDIRQFCDHQTYTKQGSKAVRRGFRQAFINDTLPCARKDTFKEIDESIKYCLVSADKGDVLVVSHSFRLKLIEAYIRTGGGLKDNPKLLENFLFDDMKTYNFGQGFTVTEKTIRNSLIKEIN